VELKEVAGVINDLVTATALGVGGLWAYIKFARGRTFVYRAEPSVSSEFKDFGNTKALLIMIELKNTGLSRIPFNDVMKVVRIFGFRSGSRDSSEPEWERIFTGPCFQEHEWLEADENIADELLYVLPSVGSTGDQFAAYRVEVMVGAKPRFFTRKKTRWHARTIFVLPDRTLDSSSVSVIR
jgi:hypothetical protein